MRTYYITLPGTGREWITTCCFAAMEFVHSCGPVGFRLFSKFDPDRTKELKEVTPIY